MSRSPGLFALTRRRFATPHSAALVIVALAALAAFVIAAAPRALVGVVRAEVAHQLGSVAPTSRDLTGTTISVPAFGPVVTGTGGEADPSAADLTDGWDDGAADVFGAVASALAAAREGFAADVRDLTAPAEFAQFDSFATAVAPGDEAPALPADAPMAYLQLLAEPAAQQHLEIIDGRWPAVWAGLSYDEVGVPMVDAAQPIEIALSEEAAATMAWPVGEVRRVPADPARPGSGWAQSRPAYQLVATVRAGDPHADRWQHLPTALTATVYDDGNRRPTATSVAWVAAASWPAVTAATEQPAMSVWYPVDATAARDLEPADLLAGLRGATAAALPLDQDGQLRTRLSTDLVSVLATALSRATSASAILAVAAVGPLAVSVALIVLASALIVRRRRTDLALMSARGAPLGRLRRLLATEGLILGVPAAVIGAVLGVLVTPNDAGWLPTVIAVLIGTAPAIALAATLRPALLTPARTDLDAPVRGRWVRTLEVIVVLLAAVAVVQLVLRGVGTQTDSIDPLVIVAPLLATVALALIVVRLHPVPLAAALAAARRGRGVVSLVGAARNLRDPAAGTTAVLAMVVAVAIAVFSSVVLATVDRGATVAAQRDVGADLRLAGPPFEQTTIERLRDVAGVVDAIGIMKGDYLTVTGPAGRGSILALVTEPARMAAAQRGFVDALPDAIDPGATPVQIIESAAVADELGLSGATVRGADVDVVASVDSVLGVAGLTEFIVMDAGDYTAMTGLGFYPRTVLVDVAADADAHAVAAELSGVIGTSHTVRFLDESTAEIQASPAVTALRFVLFAAIAVAALLSVIAILLVAGVSRDARSRVIALLRTMGLDRRRGRGLVAWEFAPLGVTALVGGVILGAVLPLLVVASIDLRPFTGGGAQPSLTVDPVLSGALIATVVVALAIAVFAGVLSARATSMATVLRTEED